jgi:hypothetical protein
MASSLSQPDRHDKFMSSSIQQELKKVTKLEERGEKKRNIVAY